MAEGLLIGQLAELANVTVKTVRHYEKLGLIPEADRQANGYRRYPVEAVLRVVLVRRLRSLGLPLTRIAQSLGDDASVRRELTMLVDLLSEEHARLEARLEKLRRLVAELDAGSDFVSALGAGSIDALRDALGDHAGSIKDETWRVERAVAGVLESLGGGGLDEHGALLEAVRADPKTFAELVEIDGELAALRDAAPDDVRVARLAARIRAARPAMEAVAKLLSRPPAATREGMKLIAAIRVSAAQSRALQLAAGAEEVRVEP